MITTKLKVIHTPYSGINLLALFQKGYTKDLKRTFMFTEESKYTTKDPKDQSDWNKLTGLASHPINSKKSSVMWAWRYYKDNFEVAPYCHDADGKKILPTPDQIFTVPVNVNFDVMIHIMGLKNDSIRFFLGYKLSDDFIRMEKVYTDNFLLNRKNYRIITSWFGGTSLPTKTVKIYGI